MNYPKKILQAYKIFYQVEFLTNKTAFVLNIKNRCKNVTFKQGFRYQPQLNT